MKFFTHDILNGSDKSCGLNVGGVWLNVMPVNLIVVQEGRSESYHNRQWPSLAHCDIINEVLKKKKYQLLIL